MYVLTTLLVAPLFWAYFHLTSADFLYEGRGSQNQVRFKLPLIGPVTVWYACIALGPLVAIISGFPLTGSLVATACALTVLMDPLSPRPPGDLPDPRGNFLPFTGLWIVSELFKMVTAFIVGLVIWLLMKLPLLPGELIVNLLIGNPKAVPGAIELPLVFYVTALAFLQYRATLASNVKPQDGGRKWHFWAVIVLGLLALRYFRFVVANLPLPPGASWEAPVSGFLVGVGLRYWFARFIASQDRLGREHASVMGWK